MQDRTSAEVVRLMKDEGIEIVDFRFCDLPGLMQHFSVPAHELSEEGFVDRMNAEVAKNNGSPSTSSAIAPDCPATNLSNFARSPETHRANWNVGVS